jgi:DNA-binding MarR family transcriptional regulator
MTPFTNDLVALCRRFGMFERDRICCGTVTVQQCVVLQALLVSPSEVRPLADSVGSSPSAMTRLVDGLVKRDWVERVRSDEDRRRVHVTLTPEGRVEAQRLQSMTDRSIETVLAAIPEEKREQVIESVALVREAIVKTTGELSCC